MIGNGRNGLTLCSRGVVKTLRAWNIYRKSPRLIRCYGIYLGRLKESATDLSDALDGTIYGTKRLRIYRDVEAPPKPAPPPAALDTMNVAAILEKGLVPCLLQEIEDEGINCFIDQDLLDLKDEICKSFDISEELGEKRISLTSKPHLSTSTIYSAEVIFDFENVAKDYLFEIHQKAKIGIVDEKILRRKDGNKRTKKDPKEIVAEIEEEKINEEEFGINFVVKMYNRPKHELTESHKYLEFSCIGGNHGLVIRKIGIINEYLTTRKSIEMFQDLSKLAVPLQQQFYLFLSSYQIEHNLSLFVLAYSQEKEKKEYAQWLEDLLEFTCTPGVKI